MIGGTSLAITTELFRTSRLTPQSSLQISLERPWPWAALGARAQLHQKGLDLEPVRRAHWANVLGDSHCPSYVRVPRGRKLHSEKSSACRPCGAQRWSRVAVPELGSPTLPTASSLPQCTGGISKHRTRERFGEPLTPCTKVCADCATRREDRWVQKAS